MVRKSHTVVETSVWPVPLLGPRLSTPTNSPTDEGHGDARDCPTSYTNAQLTSSVTWTELSVVAERLGLRASKGMPRTDSRPHAYGNYRRWSAGVHAGDRRARRSHDLTAYPRLQAERRGDTSWRYYLRRLVQVVRRARIAGRDPRRLACGRAGGTPRTRPEITPGPVLVRRLGSEAEPMRCTRRCPRGAVSASHGRATSNGRLETNARERWALRVQRRRRDRGFDRVPRDRWRIQPSCAPDVR